MKKKAILSALFSAFVACFFVACSNDSDALDINAGTRSVTSSSYMTREEVQARLDEIGDRYGTQVIIDKTVNWDFITEDVFTDLEEHLSIKGRESSNKNSTRKYAANINENDSLSLNDSSIDDIMLMAAPPSEEIYSGSFIKSVQYDIRNSDNVPSPAVCNVTIHWSSSNTVALKSVTATVEDYNLRAQIGSYMYTGGQNNDPAFSYKGTLIYTAELIKMGANGEYEYKDSIYYFQFDGTRTTGQK